MIGPRLGASLIPFEVYEIVRRVTVLRIAVFVVNVVVVVYLARRVLRERRARAARGDAPVPAAG